MIVTGMSIYKRLPQIIQEVLGTGEVPNTGIGLDYSKFDSSVQPWLIDVAFDILKQNILFRGAMEEAYENSLHYFKTRPIVIPDGRMRLKRMGIPSGSYFTQLVGSVVNYITMMYVQLKTYQTTFKTYILGDEETV